MLLLNPDTEWWVGTLADYVAVAKRPPRRRDRGSDGAQPDGTMYPSGRPFPSVVDAAGHALHRTVMPDNRFTKRYHMEGWDRTTEREVDWVSGCCMLVPRKVFEDVGMLDESFPLFGGGTRSGHPAARRGMVRPVHPGVEILHAIGVSRGRSAGCR